MKIAVTGASGFVGRFLCRELEGEFSVRAVVRPGAETRVHTGEVVAVPDIADQAALERALAGSHAVVHLAGMAHRFGAPAEALRREYHRVNVEGTRAVVAAASAAGVTRVLVASSIKAVGESNSAPWTEQTPPAPGDDYGRSKLDAERIALGLGSALSVEVVIVRFPLVYGPEAPANVLRLLALVEKGFPLPLGAVHNRRSMLFLGNLVVAVRRLLVVPGLGGRTFFLSDGVDVSTPDLIRLIAAGLGRRARLVPVPLPLLRLGGRVGDLISRFHRFPLTTAEVDRLAGSLTVCIDALRSAAGFEPAYSPHEAWRLTAEWYRQAVGR